MAKPAKNTVYLWYDGGAENAARFYAQTFPDSSVDAARRAPFKEVRFSSGGRPVNEE
jgi:predicted 3-demethylubiquinone-9 3-methyltransferase (glyoxalase superfamily)